MKGCNLDINQKAYDFLRRNQDLSNILYLTLSGSHGYGTNVPGSDVDLRGVLLEPPKYLYGLHSFEQFEDQETDTVIYGLKKFITLCSNGNPNTLELLGTDEDSIVLITPAGRHLRENADLFLSQEITRSFGNYATAQLRRLANALCHDQYDPLEQEIHLKNSLLSQLDHFNRTYTTFPEGSIVLHIDEEKPDTGILMDISLTDYPLRDFAGIYAEMANTIKTYSKLNHRNRKKDDAHLYKHAMHLIRLLITGRDILAGKGIITKRTAEIDFLMDLRKGAYSFSEIFAFAEQYHQDFLTAAAGTTLPAKPDMEKIEHLLISFYEG